MTNCGVALPLPVLIGKSQLRSGSQRALHLVILAVLPRHGALAKLYRIKNWQNRHYVKRDHAKLLGCRSEEAWRQGDSANRRKPVGARAKIPRHAHGKAECEPVKTAHQAKLLGCTSEEAWRQGGVRTGPEHTLVCEDRKRKRQRSREAPQRLTRSQIISMNMVVGSSSRVFTSCRNIAASQPSAKR